jgi:formyl-CoA transferase
VSVVDIATGQFAYEAILGALIERGNNGRGSRLNVSLFDAVAQWLAVPYLLDRYGPGAPKRVGLAHPGICPYGVFTAQCGQSFILSIQNPREWERLCEKGIRRPDLLKDQRCLDNETRVAHREFVDGEVQQGVSAMDYAQVFEKFTEADLAFAPVNSVTNLKSHPDFHTYVVKVGDESIELPRIPGCSDHADLTAKVPTLGEHTEEVLASLT